MVQVKNLRELQRYLISSIQPAIQTTKFLEDVSAREMSQAVQDVVYNRYTPEQYTRRANDGGLSDTDNINIVSVNSVGNRLVATVKNQTQGADSLRGEELGETIEEGIASNWTNPNGPWVQARRFNEETASRLQNSQELVNAYKQTLNSIGLKTR